MSTAYDSDYNTGVMLVMFGGGLIIASIASGLTLFLAEHNVGGHDHFIRMVNEGPVPFRFLDPNSDRTDVYLTVQPEQGYLMPIGRTPDEVPPLLKVRIYCEVPGGK